MYIIKIKNLPYEKPDKNSECILYPYAHGNKIDIEVRKHKSGPQIGKYRKLKGNKMLNTQTGEIKECTSHEFKNPKEIFKKFKHTTRFITNNWYGTNAELLIKLYCDTIPVNLKDFSKDFESFYRKLARKLGQKLLYVAVLLFDKDNKTPRFEVYIKTSNNVEINISQRELQALWTNGDVIMVKITQDNIEFLTDYYIPKNHNITLDIYPTNIKITRTSKSGLSHIKPEITTYEKVEELQQNNFQIVYGSTKSLVDTVDGKELEFQRYNYETYKKIEDTLSIEDTEQL